MQVFFQRIGLPCLAVLVGLLGASCDWFGPPDFTDGATDTEVDDGDDGTGTPPTVPENLAAVAYSPTKVDLSWSPSIDDVGVTGYTVYRDGASAGTTATTSYRDVNLTPGSSYTYTVDAYDAEGSRSAPSDGVPVTMTAVNVRYEILKTRVAPVIG